MKVVAFVPAKGSSSRIPSKNVQLLDGKPLFLHTIEKLLRADFIDEVYLDTESSEVAELAEETGCRILMRDPELASNKTDGHDLFYNEVRQINAEIYVQVLCTSPFISLETVHQAIKVVTDAKSEYDSAVLIRRDKQYIWDEKGPCYPIDRIPNSVDLPDTLIETMGLYVVSGEAANRTRKRIGDRPALIDASPIEAIDVNWPQDFELANLIAAGLRENDRRLISNIKHHMSSSMLSDMLDDLGCQDQVVQGLSPNMADTKILGRAKTLKLRKLREKENFQGIYGALQSYKTMVPGDIILVENEAAENAYFGELNANLAIRAGVLGVIIGGKTRDSSEVRRIGLPVFSTGFNCQDVRKRATVESINKSITINGVKVSPGDLVFGDAEGVVIIPKRVEAEIIAEAYKKMVSERSILADISMGVGTEDIVNKYGYF